MRGKAIVEQHRTGAKMIARMHHQSARQKTQAAMQRVHVDVQRKAVYTLALQKHLRERDRCRVSGG